MKWMTLCCAVSMTAGVLLAEQAENPHDATAQGSGIPMIARTTEAVAYRSGAKTEVGFKGTDLMPELTGKATIKSKRGLTGVEVKVEHLRPAKSMDLAYLTYVLWSISPEGRAKNIGELIEHDGKASLNTTTDMQGFALVITAEPHFAVSQPSELVVGENSIKPNTMGEPEAIDVRYEAFPRVAYSGQVALIENSVYGEDKQAPLELLEARNAVRIAREAGARQYAPDILEHAETLLNQADDYYRRKQGLKPVATVAREATQTAEEARVHALRAEEQAGVERRQRQEQERAEQAQQRAEGAEQRAQEAQSEADEARQRVQQAEQQAQAEAAERRQLEEQQQAAAQTAQQAQQQAQQAEQQAERAQAQAQAEARQRAAAEQQAQQAQQYSQQLQQQHAQERQQLLSQLNQVLETRNSARGLIVSMPDVLFESGSANLEPTARERLAKVAGILIAYPDIHVEVEGYTDSTGTAEFNQQLSEQRAASVESYLVQQGVPAGSVAIRGFGMANPIASNDTAAGRQQNRRVELVVSGKSIGTAAQQQP
jgi:outer membrane protein OmpA-like peptidoglycan-associated protein